MNIILIYFAIKYKGDWDKIYKALENKETVTLEEIQKLEKELKESKWKHATILDADYPKRFKEAYKPPFVFWYKGDKDLWKRKFLSLTGNKIDKFAEDRISKFVPEVLKQYALVLSLESEVDEKINKATNMESTRLFILDKGIDLFDLKLNKNDLVITEYPLGVKANEKQTKNKNRLIASFSELVILISSAEEDHITSLVTNFLNLGKEVYAFPGDGSKDDGNSQLIKQGANLITGIKDISI